MKCENCGFETTDNAKFCIQCGTPLNKEQVSEAATTEKAETVTETPVIEEKKETITEAPVIEEKKETVTEAPVIEEKKETIAEAPVVEEKVVEAPATETPKDAFPMETTTATAKPVTAPSYYSNQGSTGTYTEPESTFSNTMAIGSLICGILSILGCCCCGLNFILSIIGIVLGCLQEKDEFGKKPGMATAGIITSIVGIVIGIIAIIVFFLCFSA